jgi:hypothetical protein
MGALFTKIGAWKLIKQLRERCMADAREEGRLHHSLFDHSLLLISNDLDQKANCPCDAGVSTATRALRSFEGQLPSNRRRSERAFARVESDTPDARYRQDEQRTDREHAQAGSCQTAKDEGGKPGVRFLDRSKRGT